MTTVPLRGSLTSSQLKVLRRGLVELVMQKFVSEEACNDISLALDGRWQPLGAGSTRARMMCEAFYEVFREHSSESAREMSRRDLDELLGERPDEELRRCLAEAVSVCACGGSVTDTEYVGCTQCMRWRVALGPDAPSIARDLSWSRTANDIVALHRGPPVLMGTPVDELARIQHNPETRKYTCRVWWPMESSSTRWTPALDLEVPGLASLESVKRMVMDLYREFELLLTAEKNDVG